MTIESPDIRQLSADLGRTTYRVTRNTQKAVERTARSIKDEARAGAKKSAGRHAKGYPNAISYDLTHTLAGPGAEIGPVRGGQGSLGILEDAPGRTGNRAHKDLARAAKSNVGDFVRGLAAAAGDLW